MGRTPKKDGGRRVVYAINDDRTQLLSIELMLTKEGHEVHAFRDVAEAMRAMEAAAAPPDLVVTDLYMPGIDGWRFCRLLRSPEYVRYNKVPILVVSATFAGEHPHHITTELGANAFLPAPLRLNDFRTYVNALLMGKNPDERPSALVVEEDETLRLSLVTAFEDRGYAVSQANTLAAARDLLSLHAPSAAILSNRLSDGESAPLMETIRQSSPQAVIIITTNDPDPALALQFYRAGAYGYVRTPFDPAYVAELCERGQQEQSLLYVKERLEERTRELRESEHRYHTLFEHSVDGVLLLQDGAYIDCNEQACNIWGYTRQEIIGKGPLDFSPEGQPEGGRSADLVQKHLDVARNEGTVCFEWNYLHKNQTPLATEVTLKALSLSGNVVIQEIVHDISEHRRTQELLRRRLATEELLAALSARFAASSLDDTNDTLQHAIEAVGDHIEASRSAIILFSPDHTKVQRVFEHSPGGRPERAGQVMGLPLEPFSWALPRLKWLDALMVESTNALPPEAAGERAFCQELGIRSFALAPLRVNNQLLGVLCFSAEENERHWEDVSVRLLRITGEMIGTALARQRAEQERRRLDEKLLQTQKLESLGVLAGGIAHDFNNLLVGVLGYTELAKTEIPPGSLAHEFLGQVETAAHRAAELARQMLAYSGRGQFVVEPVRLQTLVQEIGQLLHATVPKKASLTYIFSPETPAIDADTTQLRQVVMNLIINAAEAIGDREGIICLKTGRTECDLPFLQGLPHAEDCVPGTYAYLEVTDTGCGMSAETVARVFDPFFTTKFTGRGLGLAGVLGIVRGHRGTIQVESVPGKGSRFTIYLPASAHALADPAPRTSPPALSFIGNGAILLADDEPTILRLARTMLQRFGFEVLVARDGLEAIQLFDAHASELRAAILDLTMPRVGGAEVFEHIHRNRPDLPVLMSSGYSEQDVIQVLQEQGITGFLQKPYNTADLASALRAILAHDAPPDPPDTPFATPPAKGL